MIKQFWKMKFNKYFHFLCLCRTKWKRQTAVGLELLAEAGNYSASMQRLFAPPFYYHPTQGIVSNLDGLYGLQAGQRPVLPRLFLHGLQQHVSHLPLTPRPLHPHSHWPPRRSSCWLNETDDDVGDVDGWLSSTDIQWQRWKTLTVGFTVVHGTFAYADSLKKQRRFITASKYFVYNYLLH